MTDSWNSLSDSNLPLTLKYPNPTPRGYPVRVDPQAGEAGYRVHLVSERSDEVYFEIGRYPSLTVDRAIREFLEDVTARIDGLETGEVTKLRFRSHPAHRFFIRWPGRERVILFIERDDALYRIILDPASPLNQAILDTFEFYETGESTK